MVTMLPQSAVDARYTAALDLAEKRVSLPRARQMTAD
jgi:hypothetical protein